MEVYFNTLLTDPETCQLPLVRKFVLKGQLKHENSSKVKSMPLPESHNPKWSLKQVVRAVALNARTYSGVLLGLSRRLDDC